MIPVQPHKVFLTLTGLLLAVSLLLQPTQLMAEEEVRYKRIRTQFIAALGEPTATSGVGAETWGLWRVDPGPRGVWLRQFPTLKAAGGYGPGNWKFDDNDWWLDENGLIMEKPDFPLAAGKYVVTGEREVTTILTVHPKDQQGVQRWELADSATLHDVTHMPCRSARYTPAGHGASCSPANVNQSLFKVAPGSVMPVVAGCAKQDYSVLIVVGVAVTNGT